jgi:transposase
MSHTKKGDTTMQVERLGLDIAKSSFQVHGVDAHGKVVVRKQLSRSKVLPYFAQLPPCLVGREACGGAHYWARELGQLGHEGRLMAVARLQPYRTNQKNDQNDAEAIGEAVSRPRTRFVPVKSEGQQAVLTVHRARELLVTERTALANPIRGGLMEYGIVIAQGIQRLRRELPAGLAAAETLPVLVRDVVEELRERLLELARRITEYDHRVEQLAKQNEATRRVRQVEGVGPITATAVVATIGNGQACHHGRQFAAWLGLVPKQHSTGGKTGWGRITKHGNVYLRTLLIHGARAVLQFSAKRTDRKSRWVEAVRQRRGNNMAAVALAAKHARILWALVARGEAYQLAAYGRFLIYREQCRHRMRVHNSPLAARKNDVMENGNDRHSGNPITPQVHAETVARMAPECTPDHQGQSNHAHQQAEYRRAVPSPLPIASTILAPPGASI